MFLRNLANSMAILVLSGTAMDSAATTAIAGQKSIMQSDVIVNGYNICDAESVRKVVKEITSLVDNDKPIPRFTGGACVLVAGLSKSLNRAIANRLIYDAQEVPIAVANDKCQPNVSIVFVDNGQSELRQLRKRQINIFGNLSLGEIRRLIATPRPFHMIVATTARGRDGDPIQINMSGPNTLTVHEESRIGLAIQRDITSAIMLVDRDSAIGKTPVQLADYAAMRTLVVTNEPVIPTNTTILSLFSLNPAIIPSRMTILDRGYLRAVYAGTGNQRPTTEIEEISRRISKDACAVSTADC